MTAVAFEDVPLQARALYLLACLAFEEAQYGQAVNLCKKSQVWKIFRLNLFNPFPHSNTF